MSKPPKEEWKDIAGYEGFYQVSDLGKIRSLNRLVPYKDGTVHHIKGKVLKPFLSRTGYMMIGLNKDGIGVKHSVHRLVANAFIPNRDIKPDVNHINEIKYDNRAENLEWVTPTENINHGTALERAAATNRKPVQMIKDGKVVRHFSCTQEAASAVGTFPTKIRDYCAGRQSSTDGFEWRYANA